MRVWLLGTCCSGHHHRLRCDDLISHFNVSSRSSLQRLCIVSSFVLQTLTSRVPISATWSLTSPSHSANTHSPCCLGSSTSIKPCNSDSRQPHWTLFIHSFRAHGPCTATRLRFGSFPSAQAAQPSLGDFAIVIQPCSFTINTLIEIMYIFIVFTSPTVKSPLRNKPRQPRRREKAHCEAL